jgi:hypothetical protein
MHLPVDLVALLCYSRFMKSLDQYPLMNAAVAASKSPWQQKSLTTVVKALNTYGEADSIPNPEFKDAKDALNTAVDVVRNWDGLYREAFDAAYKFEPAKYQLDFMYANQVAGKVKLATKKKFDNVQWFAICAEIVDLYEALTALKSKIVKRQMRSEEERADDYVPPMPTTAVAIKITAILKAMTDDLTMQYEEIVFNGYVSTVQYLMDHPRTRTDKTPLSFGETILMPSVGENWDSFNSCYKTLKPNFRDILRNKAHQDADYAQRMFLYKNVTKLAVIMEAKGDFTHKIIDGRVNSAGFQGEIVFTFSDGSRFTVRNKVIVNVSVHNRAFNQFPTTFHNVTGLKGQPSQEEMIEIFAGVKS